MAELQRITQDLDRTDVQLALVGALAYSVYGEPRTTKDVDVAVAISSQEELEKLIDKLISWGYGNKQLLIHTGPTHRLGFRVLVPSQKTYSIPLNILSSSCGIESEIVSSARRIEILPSLFIPVARLGHILAMKILAQNDSDRVRDKDDAVSLIANASTDDLAEAKQSLLTITERGFNRGKDLIAEFQKILQKK